jgi:hypothetical protein
MPGFQFMSKMVFVQSTSRGMDFQPATGGRGFTSESVGVGIVSRTIVVVAGVFYREAEDKDVSIRK